MTTDKNYAIPEPDPDEDITVAVSPQLTGGLRRKVKITCIGGGQLARLQFPQVATSIALRVSNDPNRMGIQIDKFDATHLDFRAADHEREFEIDTWEDSSGPQVVGVTVNTGNIRVWYHPDGRANAIFIAPNTANGVITYSRR